MYLFSCSATASQALPEVRQGETMPFIVYINFSDLFGAEYLCKLYLLKAGFDNVQIEKRKQLQQDQVVSLSEKDTDIRKAMKKGYHLRMFDRH